MSKWLIVLVLVVVAVAGTLSYAALRGGVEVEVATAHVGSIHEFVDERAKTRLPSTYLITMPYTGRIEPIKLTEGTPVKAGQVVARIVPLDLQLAVDAAQAAVDRLDASIKENDDTTVELTALKQTVEFVKSMDATVEAAHNRVRAGSRKNEFADFRLKSIQKLVPLKQATQEELQRAEVDKVQSEVDLRQDELVYSAMTAIQTATALMPTMVQQYIDRKNLSRAVLVEQRQEAKAKLQQVLEDQRRGTLTSPIDGVVLSRETSNERYLTAGTVLLEIGRLEDLQVEAEILSQDVVRVKPGDPVTIYGPAIGEPAARGRVARVYPAGFTKISSLGVEQQRVKVVVDILKEDLTRLLVGQHLGVDYRVRVRIVTAEKPDALVVPRSALFRAADGTWQVFAVRGGRAERANVSVGLMNDAQVEVTAGLKPAELVVLAPESQLSDGSRVRYTAPPEKTK